jgi:hypothetical protein
MTASKPAADWKAKKGAQVMSDGQVAEVKKRNPVITALLVACGVIGIVAGIAQMRGGLREMFGRSLDPEVEQLLTDSDAALDQANEHLKPAGTAFQGLLNDVDAQGLDVVRRDKKDDADKAKSGFAAGAAQLREAKAKLDEALKHELEDKMKSFIAAKAKSYDLLAQVCDQNQAIHDMVLDESIATYDDLTPKVLELAARRDETQKAADAATAEAEAIAKDGASTARDSD